MRTGVARPARRPLHLVRACTAIVMAIAVAAASTACGDNSPVSVPTTTLPAQQPSPTEAAPTVPEYTTDLDLNDEEKKAVDGALLAFDGFIESINSAYSGQFQAAEKFPEFASGEALSSITGEAKSIESGEAVFEGEIQPLSVQVSNVESASGEKGPNKVVVLFCVDTTQWSLTEAGQEPTANPDGQVTMEHQIKRSGDKWKVEKQSLWERAC